MNFRRALFDALVAFLRAILLGKPKPQAPVRPPIDTPDEWGGA